MAFYLGGFLSLFGLLLWLLFCFEQPRINHDNFIRFGADFPTYWDAVEYRSQHVQTGKGLISFTGNLLGTGHAGDVAADWICGCVF